MKKYLCIELPDSNYYNDTDVDALECYLRLIFGNKIGIVNLVDEESLSE